MVESSRKLDSGICFLLMLTLKVFFIKVFSFIAESVRDVIGRKIKISVKKKVKLETKGDKVDNKILVSTTTDSD